MHIGYSGWVIRGPHIQSKVPVEVIKQPPKVMHRLMDVGKSIPPLLKAAPDVTTRSQEKLATAKISPPCSTSIEVPHIEPV
jgi:hypothetical protein